LLQNQTDLSYATQDGEFINFNASGLIDQTNLQINRMERYKDYDQMDEMGEISLSLDLYADEATQFDPEHKHALLVRASSKSVKDDLEDLFYNILGIDHKLRPAARYLCKYGDMPFEIIPSVERDGVVSIRPFNIYNFLRVETQYGDLVGFYFSEPDSASTVEPQFLHPWQVVHMRLMNYEAIYQPYGRSILDGARKDFRRLRLMEDAALVYRITRAPEKRVFSVPIGDIPPAQVPNYLNQIADNFKRNRFFDPATGEVNWRYAPLIQEDDFWMPKRPDGQGPEVDTLSGAENLDQIADIVYFKKKMVSALKIPFSRVGIGDEGGEGSDKSLASTHSDFAKAVQWIQREIANGLKKVAIVHLAMRGYSAEEIADFDLSLTASSAIDELYRIETWSSRAGVIGALKETGLFPDEWILERFTDMTSDEITQMRELAAEQQPAEEGEEGAMPDIGELPGLGESQYNHALEQQVLSEYRKSKKTIIKPQVPRENTFVYLVSNNELDGLPTRPPQQSDESSLLLESSDHDGDEYLIPPNDDAEIEEAKSEHKARWMDARDAKIIDDEENSDLRVLVAQIDNEE
jgi:hypothetical protein